jgi:DNA-binding MarR family transcriptional regulator
MSDNDKILQVIQDWTEVFMHRSGREFRRFMEKSGLSFSQVNILMRLFHNGSSAVSSIGEELGFSSAAASQTVERLVQMGLVERCEDPSDRRSKILTLTEKGRELMKAAFKDRSQWVKDLAVSLPKDQQQVVTDALVLLTESARKLDQ